MEAGPWVGLLRGLDPPKSWLGSDGDGFGGDSLKIETSTIEHRSGKLRNSGRFCGNQTLHYFDLRGSAVFFLILCDDIESLR